MIVLAAILTALAILGTGIWIGIRLACAAAELRAERRTPDPHEQFGDRWA